MPNEAKESEAMLRFMNALPIHGSIVEWLGAVRDGLLGLFNDVDRVMIDVNYLCDLNDPENYEPAKAVTQHVIDKRQERVVVETQPHQQTHSKRLIQQARVNGFDPDEFHSPHCFEYFYGERAYLGAVILWRERRRHPISDETIGQLEAMRPFMIFLLSDLVARHSYSRPVDRAFHQALARLSTELKLSDREQEVLAVHLFGYPYQTIAEMIHISIDSVRKYVKAIHRKAGVATYTELFAKYFTPRLFLGEVEEGEKSGSRTLV